MDQYLLSYLTADETTCVEGLLDAIDWPQSLNESVQARATKLVQEVRKQKRPLGQLESFLQEYSLNTQEGLALMTLAEALLRVPDKATANALIRDKVSAANWLSDMGGSKDWIVKAAGVGLLMTSRTLESALSRIGEPVIREAMLKAMRMMGHQFVLGTDIEDAVKRSQSPEQKKYRMSYDMLGEGARTAIDAERYLESYENAIRYIGQYTVDDELKRPGISVKLSALHPRYEFAQREKCVPALTERLLHLCKLAADHSIALTVDAEEVDRLMMSLDIVGGVIEDASLKDWPGLGMAVQAYQKRAYPLLNYLETLAANHNRRLRIRLVKGAYWDTEIKLSQEKGVEDYPVFTRKVNTDVSYLACAQKMLASEHIYPMFATHNAHSVAAILEMSKNHKAPFEFQRLHGMGESLYKVLLRELDVPVSIYAPVGPHQDLLPYLVRRLLENGANTSFVNQLLDPEVKIADLIADPVEEAKSQKVKRHPKIPLPADIYAKEDPCHRENSRGFNLDDEADVMDLLQGIQKYQGFYKSGPLIDGHQHETGVGETVKNPANYADEVGVYYPASQSNVDDAFAAAKKGFKDWSNTMTGERAEILKKIAELFEEHTDELMSLLIREAGKTIPDALAEIREAVDFCRYYANQGLKDFATDGQLMSGPTGERNILRLQGRGVFVCISPWNFPLAIFTGQVVAALMAGNAVIAKPAGLTTLIAMRAVELMHEAGIPVAALNLLPGSIGPALVAHPDVAGIAFTGSTEVAWDINKTLANKKGPIVPLIAETGGQNTMIVDSSALPEQVVDDVVLSAFGSAGQRCSALRILCVQDDVADKIIRMLQGAMAELQVGAPGDLSTDIGPVIDESSRATLLKHREGLKGSGKLIFEIPLEADLTQNGTFFAPCAYELTNLDGLEREVFGPMLHVIRYKRKELPQLIEDINAKGYGLTLGIHSRIEEFQNYITKNVRAGNVYVNRSMIGAVVGCQAFGGMGLSGTGPKAGGPHYLHRFATEKAISIDTTASGGNASLVSLME